MTGDKEIIESIRRGEIDKFSTIVEKYTTGVYRFISLKIYNKDDVDDLVQESFINFYKAIEKFDTKRPVLPYLLEIAKNEMKMYFRSHKKALPLNENMVTEKDDIETFDMNILKHLTAEESRLLRDFSEGFSLAEIGRKYRVPVNTVKSKVRRARIKLKKIYDDKKS